MCKYLKVINQVNRPLHQICFLFLPWQLRLRKTSRPHLNWDPQSPRALRGAWRWKTLASGFWCIICLWVSPPPDSSQLWGPARACTGVNTSSAGPSSAHSATATCSGLRVRTSVRWSIFGESTPRKMPTSSLKWAEKSRLPNPNIPSVI